MRLWLVMIAGGLLTYLIRLSFIGLHGKFKFPAWLQRSLRYVPPAVLSAIIFPEILAPNGKLNLTFGNDRLIAGILAALVGWKTKNMLLTIVVGMVSLLILQAIR
jgi:branched-subunit amino acid transport protein